MTKYDITLSAPTFQGICAAIINQVKNQPEAIYCLVAKRASVMSEHSVIPETPAPRTRDSLAADLRALGVAPGMTLLVHSSLSAIGWVCGGPVAVVQALMDAVTPAGTLVMPTHTSNNTEPSYWQNPAVPASWWQTIRETMPAFEPAITPTNYMGQIVEVFRTMPETRRSAHPQVSFAAWGRNADVVTANHVLNDGLGEQSPLARVYDLDGHVLLLGIGFANNTSFHLGEYRAPNPPPMTQGAAILEDGQRVWKTFTDVDWNSDPFEEIGTDFELTGVVTSGTVGSAAARLFRQRPAVDFAAQWIAKRRSA